MKKFLYILLVAAFSSLTITACTEEEVNPKHENGGAQGIGDRLQ